jgi:anti-sigma B factor antagonist
VHALQISIRDTPPVVVAVLAGELDMATAEALDGALAGLPQNGSGTVVLDLRDLRFIDSSGLRAVIAAHREAERKGQELALIRGPEHVQQVFEITGLARRLRIVSDESQLAPASHRDDPQA